jgi:hypothetical protein
MLLTLRRLSSDTERTLGELRIGEDLFRTIERPWIENPAGPGGMPKISCVPLGLYTVIPHTSDRFPNTYALVNHARGVYYQPEEIPNGQKYGRSAILIHVGNRVRDVIGCIAVGLEAGLLEGEPAVLKSTLAIRELNGLLQRRKHQLDIIQ